MFHELPGQLLNSAFFQAVVSALHHPGGTVVVFEPWYWRGEKPLQVLRHPFLFACLGDVSLIAK